MNFSHLPQVNAKGSRVRDSQRQKVYDAEREALAEWAVRIGDGSLKAAQSYVDSLGAKRWFQSRFGGGTIEVRQKTHGRATADQVRRRINLPPWARCPRIILHEVAHIICPPEYAWHGPQFAARMLLLVKEELGDEAARKLRESYAKHRVVYRSGVPSLPPPRTEPVVTQAMRKARVKQETSAPLRPTEVQIAAGILRRAVQQGLLGAAGSKQRTYALAIARRLDTLNGG